MIDALNDRAETLIASSDAQLARNVQSKLDDLNARYGKISSSIRNHGDYLQKMLVKMNQLQSDVDTFEDWLLPMIDRMESKELLRMDLLEMGSRLMVRADYLFSCLPWAVFDVCKISLFYT